MTALLSATRGDFRGWNAAFLDNGLVRLALVPDIGGRVMAYDLAEYPFLFVDPTLVGQLFSAEENQGNGSLAAWKNYGGDKTWPAPQGWDTDEQWHGPPDPVLDTGRYILEQLSANDQIATARVVSPPDPRTGLQISRQFTIRPNSSRVAVDLTFRNISERAVRWSIWDVVQLRAERQSAAGGLEPESGCVITTPINMDSAFSRGFGVLFGADDNPQWRVRPDGLFEAANQWQIGKVAIDSPAGWIAFANQAASVAFTVTFTVVPGAEYPDGGATVEVWTVGAGQVGNLNYEHSGIYLMEAEVLSPFHTLAPGATASFPLEWGSCRCSGPIIDVSEAGALTQRPSAAREASGVRLQAAGGVFDEGELVLSWLDKYGAVQSETTLGPVTPLEALKINRLENPLPDSRAAELAVRLADGVTRLWAAFVWEEGE